jgi:GNAT superfamily N-acetyltransferase
VSGTLAFRRESLDEEPGRGLVAAMAVEIAELYDGLVLDGADMPRATPAELGPPHGAFLVGYDERDGPVCCGGLKRLDDQACEIKRMYVVPAARGRGHAKALLAALEDAARGLGYSVARLDTGPRQEDSIHIYTAAGYKPIGNFNANPMATYFGEKPL